MEIDPPQPSSPFSPRTFADLPSAYWDNKTSLRDILHSVSVLEQPTMDDRAAPHRAIQSFIMLQEWDKLYEHAHECAREAADPHMLRFLAHLMLVLRRLGVDASPAKRALDEDVLDAYISYLVQSGKVRQVAWYTAKLSPEHQGSREGERESPQRGGGQSDARIHRSKYSIDRNCYYRQLGDKEIYLLHFLRPFSPIHRSLKAL